MLNGDKSSNIQGMFLLDVIPLSLGLEDANDVMRILIKRNTSIPIKK